MALSYFSKFGYFPEIELCEILKGDVDKFMKSRGWEFSGKVIMRSGDIKATTHLENLCEHLIEDTFELGEHRWGALNGLITGSPRITGQPPFPPGNASPGGKSKTAAQSKAVATILSLRENECAAIQGPPGTGKTTVIASAIIDSHLKAIIDKKKPPLVVVSSTNNNAVDNALGAILPRAREWSLVPDLDTEVGLRLLSKASAKSSLHRHRATATKEWPDLLDDILKDYENFERIALDRIRQNYGNGINDMATAVKRLSAEPVLTLFDKNFEVGFSMPIEEGEGIMFEHPQIEALDKGVKAIELLSRGIK